MNEKTVLIVGGVLAVGIVILIMSKQSQVTQAGAALQSQALAQQAALSASPAGQVSTVLSSVGGFLNSGALGNLFQAFGGSNPGSNDPGLDSSTFDPYANDPGLDVAPA